MLKNKKLILGSIIALALIIIVVISFLFNKLNSQPTLNYATDIKEIESSNKAEAEAEIKLKPQDFTVGNISAPVQIVAYDSFSCPHCATFMNRVFPELEEKYIKTGKVLFIHREFPLDLQSLQATKLLRCFSTNNGSNVKVFDVIKSLFQSQTEWLSATEYEGKLIEIFNFAGLSKKDATACIANKELETKILEERLQAAKLLKISGTPTFFINGKKMEKNFSFASFQEDIEKILAEKK